MLKFYEIKRNFTPKGDINELVIRTVPLPTFKKVLLTVSSCYISNVTPGKYSFPQLFALMYSLIGLSIYVGHQF